VDVDRFRLSDSIVIDRPPEAVYAIVSDVTRMGELSPVCRAGTWDDAAHVGAEGAWFTGHNAIGDITWDTHCQVAAAEPGREFTFVNHGREGETKLVRWSYTFASHGDGTVVTESWQVLPAYPDFVLAGNPDADVAASIQGMADLARAGITETLGNLKRVAEA
jgi:ligand-binding SRPBCC domain-containing protein